MPKRFKHLTDREILSLAISLEEEDARTYADIADSLAPTYPATAALFEEMVKEEQEHRTQLFTLYRQQFGDHLPLIQRQHIKGFVQRKPSWVLKKMSVASLRQQIAAMEMETRRFYERAAAHTTDAQLRQLLGDLALAERRHVTTAEKLSEDHLSDHAKVEEQHAQRRLFILQIVQPGLVGLMDGSVSTLAPLFAAAFASGSNNMTAFKVGLAAAVGAGISMGFAEALSDDGALSGRGRPLIRGVACGLMTTAGGIGHTLPFLIPNFHIALWLALAVVAVELAIISWIRHRFMESPWLVAMLQVVLGGIIVLLAGIWIGS